MADQTNRRTHAGVITLLGNRTAKGRLIVYCNGPVKHRQIEGVYTAYSASIDVKRQFETRIGCIHVGVYRVLPYFQVPC